MPFEDCMKVVEKRNASCEHKVHFIAGVPSKCNLNAYFSEFFAGKRETRIMTFSCIFLNASNILNTSSDNQLQVEKLLKSLIKKVARCNVELEKVFFRFLLNFDIAETVMDESFLS